MKDLIRILFFKFVTGETYGDEKLGAGVVETIVAAATIAIHKSLVESGDFRINYYWLVPQVGDYYVFQVTARTKEWAKEYLGSPERETRQYIVFPRIPAHIRPTSSSGAGPARFTQYQSSCHPTTPQFRQLVTDLVWNRFMLEFELQQEEIAAAECEAAN